MIKTLDKKSIKDLPEIITDQRRNNMMMDLTPRQELDRYRLDHKSYHSRNPRTLSEQDANARNSLQRNMLHKDEENTPSKHTTPGRVRGPRSTPHRAMPSKTALRSRDPKEVLLELLATIKPPSPDSVILRDMDITKQLFLLKNKYKEEVQRICQYKRVQKAFIEKDRIRALEECKENGIKIHSIHGLYNNMLHRLLDRVESEIHKMISSSVNAATDKEEENRENLKIISPRSHTVGNADEGGKQNDNPVIKGGKQNDNPVREGSKPNKSHEVESQELQKRCARRIHKGDQRNQCNVGQQTSIEKNRNQQTSKENISNKRNLDGYNRDTTGSCPLQSSASFRSIEKSSKYQKRQRKENAHEVRGELKASLVHTDAVRPKTINQSELQQIKTWKKQLFETKSRLDDEEEPDTGLTCVSLFSLHNNQTTNEQSVGTVNTGPSESRTAFRDVSQPGIPVYHADERLPPNSVKNTVKLIERNIVNSDRQDKV